MDISTWHHAILEVKVFIIILTVLAATATVRLIRIAWRLFSFKRRSIPVIDMSGKFEPETFARYALAQPCERVPGYGDQSTLFVNAAPDEPTLALLNAAEDRFLHLWNELNARVRQAKRAGILALWLSFLSQTHGFMPAFMTFDHLAGDRTYSLSLVVLRAIDHSLKLLTFELAICMGMYCTSRFMEDTLLDRKACWVANFDRWKRMRPSDAGNSTAERIPHLDSSQ